MQGIFGVKINTTNFCMKINAENFWRENEYYEFVHEKNARHFWHERKSITGIFCMKYKYIHSNYYPLNSPIVKYASPVFLNSHASGLKSGLLISIRISKRVSFLVGDSWTTATSMMPIPRKITGMRIIPQTGRVKCCPLSNFVATWFTTLTNFGFPVQTRWTKLKWWMQVQARKKMRRYSNGLLDVCDKWVWSTSLQYTKRARASNVPQII